MTKTCFVTLAVTTIDVPAARDSAHPAAKIVAAIAMLVAKRDDAGDWSFTLERRAIGAGTGEDALMAWATPLMPEAGTVIGWQLADRVVAPLIDAATIGDAEIGRDFLDRLMVLVTSPSIDLAIGHGGAGAPDLAIVCADRHIALYSQSAGHIASAWSFGELRPLTNQVSCEAIAVWQLWLAESNGHASAASDAFADWLASQIF
ncbi:hypothetical protein SPAN111604_14855 [Sphingomonas antarctica]|uniref:hypothetical protein n=1 Tax=Sphingomonas antarctica TaxID=2040274 RepID=UPI0039E8FCD7